MKESQIEHIKKLSLPPLPRAEEEELIRAAQAGDQQAREKVIRSNTRFAVSEAAKYRGRGVTFEDLVQEAIIGLAVALDKFDVDAGKKYITYAVHWIRQRVLMAIDENVRVVRYPSNVATDRRAYIKRERELEQAQGRAVSWRQVNESLGLSEARQVGVWRSSFADVRLDLLAADNSPAGHPPIELRELYALPNGVLMAAHDEIAATSELPDECADQILDTLHEEEQAAAIRQGLEELPPRMRHILQRYYGLDGDEPETLEEIGAALGVTRERVRQIKEVALTKLKQMRSMHYAQSL